MAKKPAPKKPTAKKMAKPVAKKPVAKKVVKAAPKKAAAKPIAKKVVKPLPKKAAKPVAKKVVKPVAKKAVAKKPAKVAKPVAKKPAPKASKVKPVKVVAKPVVKKVKEPLKKETKAIKPAKVAKPTKAEKHSFSKQNINIPIPELKLREIKKVGPQPIKRSTVDSSRTRYSDAELKEFHDLIMDKLTKSKEELHYIQQQITKSSENSTADTENRFGGMEDGAGTLEREYLNQMATRLGTFIGHMEKALMRIENKTYGICRITGKLISKERLMAVPHATLSLEAKELEKK